MSESENKNKNEATTTATKKKGTPPNWTKFLASGLGGTLGWLPVHPFDVAKVRMQIDETSIKNTGTDTIKNGKNIGKATIQKRTLFTTLGHIMKSEGFTGMYKGLSAAVTRQLTYTTLRLGLYDVFRSKVIDYRNSKLSDSNGINNNSNNSNKIENITLWEKLICGLSAGGIAATICNPVEVALVRMQADGAQKDLKLKRNYKNVFDAWIRVTREEGFLTLYRGVRPTVARGMVVSCVQLASYDQAKTMISSIFGDNQYFSDGPLLHFSASLVSGYLYCLASLPLDICKTRMQNQHKIVLQPSGATAAAGNAAAAKATDGLMYKSIPQTMYKIVQNEGALALWKGFIPYFARGGGHTICMFLWVEQIKKQINKAYE